MTAYRGTPSLVMRVCKKLMSEYGATVEEEQ